MSSLHNDVYDDGLNAIVNNANVLHILSADPGLTYASIATTTLGNKSLPTINIPENHTTGRKVTVDAITDGTSTDTGTGSHFALVDSVNSKILASAPLDANVSITSGTDFTLTALYVAIPAPV